MTLRDYLAAKAMQGLIAHRGVELEHDGGGRLAKWSYQYADAMLKARDGK